MTFVLALLGSTAVAGAQGTQVTETAKTSLVLQTPQKVTQSLQMQVKRIEGAPLVLEVTIRQYGADNQPAGSAGMSATPATGKVDGYAWTNAALCGTSASSTEPASVPGVGWHYTATVIESSPVLMNVRVEWQRLWDKGARVQGGPAGSQTVTLREGERLELDRVLPVGESSCATANARLEAAVISRPAYLVGVANDRLAAARAMMAGGRGGGGGGGRGVATAGGGGGAASTTTGTGAAAGAAAGGARGGRAAATTATAQRGTGAAATGTTATGAAAAGARGGRGGGAAAAGTATGTLDFYLRPGSVGSFDAELWLVHRKPDGTENVQQQTARVGGTVLPYTFPPIPVSTSRGTITLDVSGKLMVFTGDPPDPNQLDSRLLAYRKGLPSGRGETPPATRLMVSISRRARASGTPLLDITGGSTLIMDLPAPADVLSFEFPALQKAAEDLLKGHQFSLRVRVTPVGR